MAATRFKWAASSLCDPSRLYCRGEVMSRPNPVPKRSGVYAWYFKEPPPGIDTRHCHTSDGKTLLYIGIAPRPPYADGRNSRQTLSKRLRTHCGGNAAGSTLRQTLGCLLGEKLSIALRRVGSGGRYTFTNPGECTLDDWMAENAYVTWLEDDSPWEIEGMLLKSNLTLPLNISGIPRDDLCMYLSKVRSLARERAAALPALSDSGGPRRRHPDTAGSARPLPLE